jgi:putative ABC transport system ATP-binding protein
MNSVCELINVSKSYNKREVLSNINLSVEAGDMIAITGKSGCGKSTLLNMIGLLEKPDKGKIKLLGYDNLHNNPKQRMLILRNSLSYLFQNYALIDNASVDYNLEIPLTYADKNKKEKEKMKREALERVGLSVGLNQRVHELSGGEQQRVALARILLKPCELILGDEPTGSLDSENRDAIMGILKELNKQGKTIILVTHDEEVAKVCHRKINLSELNKKEALKN